MVPWKAWPISFDRVWGTLCKPAPGTEGTVFEKRDSAASEGAGQHQRPVRVQICLWNSMHTAVTLLWEGWTIGLSRV